MSNTMPPKPWEVPLAPPPAAPAPSAPAGIDPSLIEALKQLFGGNAQPAPPQGIVGGGQGSGIIDPLQQAAQLAARNQAIARGTGNR